MEWKSELKIERKMYRVSWTSTESGEDFNDTFLLSEDESDLAGALLADARDEGLVEDWAVVLRHLKLPGIFALRGELNELKQNKADSDAAWEAQEKSDEEATAFLKDAVTEPENS
jgi:hypothetical protein